MINYLIYVNVFIVECRRLGHRKTEYFLINKQESVVGISYKFHTCKYAIHKKITWKFYRSVIFGNFKFCIRTSNGYAGIHRVNDRRSIRDGLERDGYVIKQIWEVYVDDGNDVDEFLSVSYE